MIKLQTVVINQEVKIGKNIFNPNEPIVTRVSKNGKDIVAYHLKGGWVAVDTYGTTSFPSTRPTNAFSYAVIVAEHNFENEKQVKQYIRSCHSLI